MQTGTQTGKQRETLTVVFTHRQRQLSQGKSSINSWTKQSRFPISSVLREQKRGSKKKQWIRVGRDNNSVSADQYPLTGSIIMVPIIHQMSNITQSLQLQGLTQEGLNHDPLMTHFGPDTAISNPLKHLAESEILSVGRVGRKQQSPAKCW